MGFLVDMLSYKAPSKTLAIVENAGGILRNISSHIAVREDYRYEFTSHYGKIMNCVTKGLQILYVMSILHRDLKQRHRVNHQSVSHCYTG